MLRPALAVLLLALLTPSAEELRFAPAKDHAVSKRFTMALTQELDELSILAGGTDVSDMIGDVEFTFEVDTAVAVDDTYVETEDGRPVKLVRLYDEIAVAVSASYAVPDDSGTESQTLESELEGETVVFTRDPSGAGYTVAFEKDEGDDQLLAGLVEDMDLRALLPTTEVEEGAEWMVDPVALKAILQPGGSLGMDTGDEDPEHAEMMSALDGVDFDAMLSSILSGEITCTYKGVRESDAGRLAVIEILVEIDSSTDLSDLCMDLIESLGDDVPSDFDLPTAELGLGMEGTGLLEWNLDEGRFQHFEASVDTEITFHVVAEAEGEGVDATLGLSGSLELGADVEVR